MAQDVSAGVNDKICAHSRLLAMFFRSQAQINLPVPGLDNNQTALPREEQIFKCPTQGE